VSSDVLARAAREAPDGAGVYFFVSPVAELLYIGKAGNLRRRLGQHARPARSPLGRVYRKVAAVHWEEVPDEPAARAREADLIVALRPVANAALWNDGRWVHLVVRPVAGDRLSFTLTADRVAGDGRVYGCFPHLGRGLSSLPGTACSDGYPALLRALWVVASNEPVPRVLTSTAPPTATVPVAPGRRRALHDLLAGTSMRLLDDLGGVDVDPLQRRSLTRDLAAADGFARHGPRWVRALRRRYDLPTGPVSRADIERLLADEVRAIIGPFHVPSTPADEMLLGFRRNRGRALRRLR
jgi:predicted GIY-YIG superfamily endonuclease